MSDSKYFHRGREARANNRQRIAPDGRLSISSRQDFYEGWEYEDQMRSPKPSPEQLAEVNAGLAAIRAELAAMP